MRVIYLDGSALCRFLPGVRFADEWTAWVDGKLDQLVTTQLGFTELRQAAELYPRDWQDDVNAIVATVRATVKTLRFSDDTVELSSHATAVLKPFAALHIGAAVSNPSVDAIVTYDPALAHVAEIYKLAVHSPGLEPNWHHKYEGPPENWDQVALDAPEEPPVATPGGPTAAPADATPPGDVEAAGSGVDGSAPEGAGASFNRDASDGAVPDEPAEAGGGPDVSLGGPDVSLGGAGAAAGGVAGTAGPAAAAAGAAAAGAAAAGAAAVAGVSAGAGAGRSDDGEAAEPTDDGTEPPASELQDGRDAAAAQPPMTELEKALREAEASVARREQARAITPGVDPEEAALGADDGQSQAEGGSPETEFADAGWRDASADDLEDGAGAAADAGDEPDAGNEPDADEGPPATYVPGQSRSRDEVIASIGSYEPPVQAWKEPEPGPSPALARSASDANQPGPLPGDAGDDEAVALQQRPGQLSPGADAEAEPDPAAAAAPETPEPEAPPSPADEPNRPPAPPTPAPRASLFPPPSAEDSAIRQPPPGQAPFAPPVQGSPSHGQAPPPPPPGASQHVPPPPPAPPATAPHGAPPPPPTAPPAAPPEGEPRIVHHAPPGDTSAEAKPLTVPIQWNIEFDEPESYEPSSYDGQDGFSLPRSSSGGPARPTDAPAPPPGGVPELAPESPSGQPANADGSVTPFPLDADVPPAGAPAADEPKRKGRFGRKQAAKRRGKGKGSGTDASSKPAGSDSPWKLDDVFGSDSP